MAQHAPGRHYPQGINFGADAREIPHGEECGELVYQVEMGTQRRRTLPTAPSNQPWKNMKFIPGVVASRLQKQGSIPSTLRKILFSVSVKSKEFTIDWMCWIRRI